MSSPLAEHLLEALPAWPGAAGLQFGFVTVVCVYGVCLLLHVAVPATAFDGYVLSRDGKAPLSYRLNGLRVLLIMLLPFPTGKTARHTWWGRVVAENFLGVRLGYPKVV